MQPMLTPDALECLCRFSTCTIANAIEIFNVRPRTQGLLSADIRCLFPGMGVMVGYAVTSRIRTGQPAAGELAADLYDYWDYTQSLPRPRIAAVQDLDPTPVGAIWGDINATVHKALGFRGAVTNGGVRDLAGVRDLGFHFFARAVLVSHAYSHFVDFGTPVEVGGALVRPGDLVHGDEHGVLVIPHEIAGELAAVAEEIELREQEIVRYCRTPGFGVPGLKAAHAEIHSRWPSR